MVRGSGDVGSAVAHALFEAAGYAVFIHDSTHPAATRRRMAFYDATFDREAVLVGVGQDIWEGATRPLAGEPRENAGHARDRYVYAPIAGILRTSSRVGAMVAAGQKVAGIGEITLHTPIDGILRGLTHDNVPVTQKAKVIEVDPIREQTNIAGIAERRERIALGVLEAIKQGPNL